MVERLLEISSGMGGVSLLVSSFSNRKKIISLDVCFKISFSEASSFIFGPYVPQRLTLNRLGYQHVANTTFSYIC